MRERRGSNLIKERNRGKIFGSGIRIMFASNRSIQFFSILTVLVR